MWCDIHRVKHICCVQFLWLTGIPPLPSCLWGPQEYQHLGPVAVAGLHWSVWCSRPESSFLKVTRHDKDKAIITSLLTSKHMACVTIIDTYIETETETETEQRWIGFTKTTMQRHSRGWESHRTHDKCFDKLLTITDLLRVFWWHLQI